MIKTKNYKIKSNGVFKYSNFNYNEFTRKNFIGFIMENFNVKHTYSFLIVLGFKGNSVFLTCGKQIGVNLLESHDIGYYSHIHFLISLKIEDIISQYNFDSSPDTVMIAFKDLNIEPRLKFNNLKSIVVNNKIISKSEQQNLFGSRYLPLSLDIKDYGFLVEGDVRDKHVNMLKKNILKSGMEVLNFLNNDKLLNLSNVFITKVNSRNDNIIDQLIVSIKLSDYFKFINPINYKENLILSNFIINDIFNENKEGFIRFSFDMRSGICLNEAIDLVIGDSVYLRNINNFVMKIVNNKVIEITRSLNINYIKPPRFKGTFMSNPNIGVLDLETFTNSKGLGQVYSIGFGTLVELENIKTFYLTDFSGNLNSNLLIITCINSMLESKYNNFYWYIHNMGKFDMVYIHKCLEEYNLNSKRIQFELNPTFKDGRMLRLVIRKRLSNKKVIKITFLDSVNILNDSLSNLTKEFKVNHIKSVFPYSFVNENNLNYVGDTPSINYYKNLSLSEYNNIKSSNWSLKEETLKYLKIDISGLLEVLDKFKSKLFLEHNLELTEGLTISRLALNKYLKNYMKESKIPLINKLNIFNFMYSGYFGGRTEVFKPHGTNLYYYDVNSLYPKVALEGMPGIKSFYIKSFDNNGLNINELFGIFKAKVKAPDSYLGLLPVKSKEGLIFPTGEYEGVWPSPELKFALEHGYSVVITEGYNFEKVPSYFKDYILDLYNLKSKTKGVEKRINKSLLNNLLGRFGLNIVKPVTKLVDNKTLDYLLSTRQVKSIQEIAENRTLINYNPLIDYNVCMEHGVDYLKALTDNKNNFNIEKNIDIFEDVSVVVSALVTSYARIYTLNVILLILNSGGNVYYTDTDSIVTDIPLENINPDLVGPSLGQFKLEYLVKEAYFISNKTYCLVLNNGEVIIKCKGIMNDSLTLEDFKDMYYISKDALATKLSSKTNLSEGSVILENKKILLQHNGYTKRLKIKNNQGLWIDTKPLVYNNVEKRIIPYNPNLQNLKLQN